MPDGSEEYIISILRFKEYAKQEQELYFPFAFSSSLFGLLFDPENGGDMFLRNVGLINCLVLYYVCFFLTFTRAHFVFGPWVVDLARK
jgi:hypothetical protein